jgi:hypothetical protein
MSDGTGSNDDDNVEDERGVGDYTSYHQYKFTDRCGHWTHSHVDEKQYPAVQAAIILEVGIRNSEDLEKCTSDQHSFCLKTYKKLVTEMIRTDVIPRDLKGKFSTIEGTSTANELTGKQILKRYKLFKKYMMNTLVPMLPKNIHDIPSGKQLWEAFDRIWA